LLSLPPSCEVSFAPESGERNEEVSAMPLTIALTDDLVGRLRMQAQTQELNVEQGALTTLGHAAEHPDELLCKVEWK
jgi:hypothetical protein